VRGGFTASLISHSTLVLTVGKPRAYPDVDAYRRRFVQMEAGDYDALRNATDRELEASSQHELLDWMPLFGAMAQLKQQPGVVDTHRELYYELFEGDSAPRAGTHMTAGRRHPATQ
jgi:hypothetical protein